MADLKHDKTKKSELLGTIVKISGMSWQEVNNLPRENGFCKIKDSKESIKIKESIVCSIKNKTRTEINSSTINLLEARFLKKAE